MEVSPLPVVDRGEEDLLAVVGDRRRHARGARREGAEHEAGVEARGAERDDEGGQPEKGDQDSVEGPHEKAEAGGNRVGQENAAGVVLGENDFVGHVHREGCDRGEGHVDAARDDDHHAADGEKGGHDEGARQVDQVVAGEELTGPRLDQQAEGDDGGEDPGLRPGEYPS